MPEIRIGALPNLEDVRLGGVQIEEVRLGTQLVWRNNALPTITVTGPTVGVMGDNIDITVIANRNNTVDFSYVDADPLDTVSTITVTDPNGANVAVLNFTPGQNTGTASFVIDGATFFPTVDFDVMANNVYTITITDSRGGEGEMTVTVTAATFVGPVIGFNQDSQSPEALTAGGAQSATFTWTVTPDASAAGTTTQYSIDGGNTWITGTMGSRTLSAVCGDADSVSVSTRSVRNLGMQDEVAVLGNTGSRSINVTAPNASFPLNYTGCIARETFTGTAGGNLQDSFTAGQTCDGTINTAGQTREGTARLSAGRVFVDTSSPIYVGTSLPTATVDGNAATVELRGQAQILITGDYTIPAVAGTAIEIVCTGGDYTNTATAGVGRPSVTPVTVAVGATANGSLTGGAHGAHYRFLTLDCGALLTITPVGVYGNAAFTAVGVTAGSTGANRCNYTAEWRLPDGTTRDSAGTTERVTHTVTM